MEVFLKIVSFGLITGMVSMLIIKVISHLTRDKEEKFYTPEETEEMRKRAMERLKQNK